MEHHSIHSGPDSRMNGVNGIRFAWNRQNMHPFGKILAGNPTWPPWSAIFVSGHTGACVDIVVLRSPSPGVFHFQNEHSFGN